MKRFFAKRQVQVSILVVLVGFLVGYSVDHYILSPQEPENDVLTLAVNPSSGGDLAEDQFEQFASYLAESLDMQVDVVLVADYTAVIEAMKYGHVDIARVGTSSYIQAAEEAQIEVFVTSIKQKSGRADYRSLIITQHGVTDLNGASFAYVDPGSGSGYLAPAHYIKQEGIELGEVFFAGSHPAVIEAIKNGSVSAGAVADNQWYYAIQGGAVGEDELQIFWISDPMPNSPWVVQIDMDPGLKARILEVFLKMPEEVVLSTGFTETNFVPISDGDYDYIRELQASLEG